MWAIQCHLIIALVVFDACAERLLYYETHKKEFTADVRNEALFGYSVTYQKNNAAISGGRLVVGAPEADAIGAVFSCDIDKTKCDKISLVMEASNSEAKHDYWFGATVRAGKDFVISCAPLQIKVFNPHNRRGDGISGRCYHADATKESGFTKLYSVPTRSTESFVMYHHGNIIQYELTMDTFGWSIDVCEDLVLVGGPGMSTGRVMVYKKKLSTKTLGQNPVLLDFDNSSVSYNFGYSVASGNISGQLYHAVSSPYGTIGKGMVFVYKNIDLVKNPDNKPTPTIVNEGLGALFGASMCFVNVKVEKENQILLVGAPTFIPQASTSKYYDVGAVYVYESVTNKYKTNVKFIQRRRIDGFSSGGYFGKAIINLGDLNHDQFDEVAISAPYEEEGRGAVYLYSGADLYKNQEDRPNIKWLQRFEGQTNQFFGYSLTALSDFDENGCNELAIGAPGTNSVTTLSCIASVDIQLTSKVHSVVDIKAGNDKFNQEICVNMTRPEKPKTINSVLLIHVSITHPNATLVSGDEISMSMNNITTANPKCTQVSVRMALDSDFDKPVKFHLTADVERDPTKETIFDPNLVDLIKRPELFFSVPFIGSNLTYLIKTSLKDGYLVGSTETETVTVIVTNTGKMAHSACVRLRIDGAEIASRPVSCTHGSHGVEEFTCHLTKPLSSGGHAEWPINLETKTMTSDVKAVMISAKLYRSCEVDDYTPLMKNVSVTSSSAGIMLTGVSSPGDVVNVTKEALSSGKIIQHIYRISNKGPSNWGQIEAEVILPAHVNHSVKASAAKMNTTAACKEVDHLKVRCTFDKLFINHLITITVSIKIFPECELIGEIKAGDTNVTSQVTLIGLSITRSLTSTLKLMRVSTPIWIIIVAGVVGIFILLLVAFALYECGFLRRKKKELLQDLQQEVKRQSVRRSMRLRESQIIVVTNQQPEEQQRLIGLPEENEIQSIESIDSCHLRKRDIKGSNADIVAELNQRLAKAPNSNKIE